MMGDHVCAPPAPERKSRKYHRVSHRLGELINCPVVSPPPEKYEAYTPYSPAPFSPGLYSPASPEKPGHIPPTLDVDAASK